MESDGCLRSHFLPFWPRQLAPFLSRTPFCQVDRATKQPGHPLSVSLRWVQHPTSNRLGTDRVCWLTSWLTHVRKQLFGGFCPHAGDWLSVLPIASCGLHLDDDAIRVAVALRLGLELCVPHTCHCGSQIDAWGLHAFVCKRAPGRIMRHQSINDLICRAFVSAGVPAMKEPTGLLRTDNKRPDGVTLIL